MPELHRPPTGTVTFLFTDIEGFTKRWEAHPQQMRAALQRHDAILHSAIGDQGGYVFKTVGDAVCAAFSSALDALLASLHAQQALQQEDWPQETGQVAVRVALHTGTPEEWNGDYFGPPVNRVARQLLALAHAYGEPAGEGAVRIPLRLTQGDFAGLIGATRVRVNQVLVAFKERDYISVDHNFRITIRDREALALWLS